MPSHLRRHSFTGNSDHNFTGLVPNELLKLNSSGTAIESFGTASTISLSSITNVDYIDFNTATTSTVQTGRLIWNDADEIGGLEVGMRGGNVTLQIGEENLVRVYNDDTVTLTNGMVVYVFSSQGNTLSVRRASSTGETTSARALGVVAESIPVAGRGFVNSYGLIRDLNTIAYTGGTPLYIGTTSGTYTNVRPTAPNHTCLVGFVSRVSATVGSIFVHISNGWELNELHDVYYVHSALTQNNLLYWDTGNTRWQATGTTALGIVTTTGGTLNYVPKFAPNGYALSNSQIYDDGTNVGIGTTSPTQKLHVSGGNINIGLGNSYYVNNVKTFGTDSFNGQSLQIGVGANGTNQASDLYVALGPFAYSTDSGIAIGYAASANTGSFDGIAIGRNAVVDFNLVRGLALGRNANAKHNNAWALGFNAITTQDNEFNFGANGTDHRMIVHGRIGVGENLNSPSERLHISGGTIRIQTVNSTEGAGKIAVSDAGGAISFSSTTALNLGTVGGTGTAGRIAKWATSTTLTDSLISETGTGVTVNGSIYIYGNVDILGTATTINTQTVQALDNNILLNYSGNHLSALYGGITILSGKSNNTPSTLTIDSTGTWSANSAFYSSCFIVNEAARLSADTSLNTSLWGGSVPTISATRNTAIGSNDTGTFSLAGGYNTLLGNFTTIGLTTAANNILIGAGNSTGSLVTGTRNIGFSSTYAFDASYSLGFNSNITESSAAFFGDPNTGTYQNWFLGAGKTWPNVGYGTFNMNWYPTSMAEGQTNGFAPIPIWRLNGSRATGSGSSGDIRFAVSLSGASGTLWNPLVDKITVQGNSGFVGINKTTPTVQMDIVGDTRIQDVAGTYGVGKLAVSDATGKISFSSTTALGLVTGSSISKYSTTLTTPAANATNTITHNLGTTDITATLWLVTTGDMTSARITNRQTNSVDVIFASAPGENVRVVITG